MTGTWIHRPADVEAFTATLDKPTFSDAAPQLAGVGKGKVILHHKVVEKVMGRPLDAGPQETGDCAGWTGASALDVCACVDVHFRPAQKETYNYALRCAVEGVYALAREVGGYLGNEQGATLAWVARAFLLRGTVGRAYVKSPYSGTRSNVWGRTGMPRRLLPQASGHRVGAVSRVLTLAQCRDSVASWNPVMVGYNNVGWNGKRDRHGFISPEG